MFIKTMFLTPAPKFLPIYLLPKFFSITSVNVLFLQLKPGLNHSIKIDQLIAIVKIDWDELGRVCG